MAGASALRMAVQTLVLPVVGRLLGPETLGQLALVAPFVYFALLFAEAGLGACLLRTETVSRALESSIFVFALALSCLIVALFAISAVPLGHLLHQPSFPTLLLSMSSILVLAAFNIVPASLLLRNQRYDLMAISDIASVVAGVAAIAVGVTANWGVWSLVAQQIAIWVCKLTVLYWATGWRPTLQLDWTLLKTHLSFGLHLTGSSIVAFLSRNIDNVLIGAMLGETILGYYTLALQIIGLPQSILSGSLYFTALTRVSEAKRQARTAVTIFLQVLRGTLLVCTPMIAGLAAIAPTAVPLFLGEKWRPATIVLVLLAPYGLCQALWPSLSGVIGGEGRAKLSLSLNFVNGMLTILGIVVTVRFGSAAVAMSVSATAIVGLLFGLYFIKKSYDITWVVVARCFFPPLMSSAIMLGGLLWLGPWFDRLTSAGLSLSAQVVIGALLYSASIGLIFRRHVSDEAVLIRNLVLSRIKR